MDDKKSNNTMRSVPRWRKCLNIQSAGSKLIHTYRLFKSKMDVSPGTLFEEGEAKMNELNNDPAYKKYVAAADLFKRAATGYTKVRNYSRAGDSWRRMVDCMFHEGNLVEAANCLCEAARSYAKGHNCTQQCAECFRLGIKTYLEQDKKPTADKVMVEAAKLFEKAKCYDVALEFHQQALQHSLEQSITQYVYREQKSIGAIYVTTKRWEEASTHFISVYTRLTEETIMKDALEYGLLAVLALLAVPKPNDARLLAESNMKINRTWETSEDGKLAHDVVLAYTSRNLDKTKALLDAYSKDHTTIDPVFNEIVKIILQNLAD